MTPAGAHTAGAVEAEIHRLALELPLAELSDHQVTSAVAGIAGRLAPLADAVSHDLTTARVVQRLRGLGPLEELLQTPGVTDVMINGPGPIWVEQDGRLRPTEMHVDAAAIDHLVERMVAPLGRRLDRTSPLVDGRLPDGSRVHVAAAPVGVGGPYVTIRRFEVHRVPLEEASTPGVAALLRWAVQARSNILVCGGTGSGKTTLLNALAAQIDDHERVVTIEDAAELRLETAHVVRLETRPAMVDGPAPITIRELVRNALRMRPDRIIVGEVRGAEAIDMLQAMNTGHDGSLSTVHANTPGDALRRLQAMVLMGSALPHAVVRAEVAEAVDLVVHMERLADGRRRIAAVAEPRRLGAGAAGLDEPAAADLLTDPSGRLCRLPVRPQRRRVNGPRQSWLDEVEERCP